MSYIEIYNESINDLLDGSKTGLEIREDRRDKHISIEGLSKFEVKTAEDVKAYLAKGNQLKKIAESKMNAQSSRSHTVFRMELQMVEQNTQTKRKIIKSSVINLVDLAGSEGVGKM